jgi:hypothetical protein
VRKHNVAWECSERSADGNRAGTEDGQEADEHPRCDMANVELLPEGPCGFEPLPPRPVKPPTLPEVADSLTRKMLRKKRRIFDAGRND